MKGGMRLRRCWSGDGDKFECLVFGGVSWFWSQTSVSQCQSKCTTMNNRVAAVDALDNLASW